MKTKILLLLLTLSVALTISSCSPKIYGLRGNYEITNSIETSSSYNDVWSKVIDYFAINNIPIATLEKESGIIVASAVNISKSMVSVESENGAIIDNSAWFVFPYEKYCIGGRVQCSFNVRVKTQDNGKTLVSINLGSIIGYKTMQFWSGVSLRKEIIDQQVPSTCYSTGKFEKELLRLFK